VIALKPQFILLTTGVGALMILIGLGRGLLMLAARAAAVRRVVV
jgi:hypothetical protein